MSQLRKFGIKIISGLLLVSFFFRLINIIAKKILAKRVSLDFYASDGFRAEESLAIITKAIKRGVPINIKGIKTTQDDSDCCLVCTFKNTGKSLSFRDPESLGSFFAILYKKYMIFNFFDRC